MDNSLKQKAQELDERQREQFPYIIAGVEQAESFLKTYGKNVEDNPSLDVMDLYRDYLLSQNLCDVEL